VVALLTTVAEPFLLKHPNQLAEVYRPDSGHSLI
jgi:hypothetical protein